MPKFQLEAQYTPSRDQQKAIDFLLAGIENKAPKQVMLGVTGSGKTFTMASVIAKLERPTLVLTHNKTLTAQLYNEFKEFFPHNAVEYFVSYYDYYQPEAYVPQRDLYIEKDASINDNLDKLRLSATRSLFEREDVIIVSSVSCIYGLGSPEAYLGMMVYFMVGQSLQRNEVQKKLTSIQYARSVLDFQRGTFRSTGDVLDIYPAYDDFAIRLEFFGDQIEKIYSFDPLTGAKKEELTKIAIYPASHYVQPPETMDMTLKLIKQELEERLVELKNNNKLLEAERLKQRTNYDMEMLEETGSCPGIENYSRILTRRQEGEPPPTLIDYFPKSSLLFIDESHVTLPQLHGMYKGDRARKHNLVDYGFRLPSALDNRPLRYEEFEQAISQVVYVSATPGDYEIEVSKPQVVELITRPTGLLDPEMEVRPSKNQVEDFLAEVRKVVERKERVLVTTLTKRMAEDITNYYEDLGIKVRYLHSDIDAIERSEIIRNLRLGTFDVLVGINLLREGLDLPEVSLVGVFDADKEGFLRSYRSLLQTSGRAARNVNGRVILYGDSITPSMRQTLEESSRRRKIQRKYNEQEGITPRTILKKIPEALVAEVVAQEKKELYRIQKLLDQPAEMEKYILKLRKDMLRAAKALDFEKATELRDKIKKLENIHLGIEEAV